MHERKNNGDIENLYSRAIQKGLYPHLKRKAREMIKSENFITIQGWMVSELGLSRNDLLCYALIYGFCQDGQSCFSGTSSYISEWLNIDKRNVLSVLKRLCERGLIIKIEKIVNGIKLCDYKTSYPVMKHHWGYDETSGGGYDETSPHIYSNSKDINKDNNKKDEFSESPIKEAIEKWLAYKKERNQSYKTTGLKACIEKLERLSNNDSALAMRIVEESISNNWSGLFPLKEKKSIGQSINEKNWKIIQDTFGLGEENADIR